ncbi:MAG: transporter, partial [Blastococcus sp.]
MTDRRRAPLTALTTLTRRPRAEVRPVAGTGAEPVPPTAGPSRMVDNAVYSSGRRVATPASAAESRQELTDDPERMAWLGLYRPEAHELGELAEL